MVCRRSYIRRYTQSVWRTVNMNASYLMLFTFSSIGRSHYLRVVMVYLLLMHSRSIVAVHVASQLAY